MDFRVYNEISNYYIRRNFSKNLKTINHKEKHLKFNLHFLYICERISNNITKVVSVNWNKSSLSIKLK